MKTINKLTITKNLSNKKINMVREFGAPLDKVWSAWTESSKLDQWYAPKPWKASTKEMNFREGGRWLYCMIGPKGDKMWSRGDFMEIIPQNSFTVEHSFCDEFGNEDTNLPKMIWKNRFISTKTGCKMMMEMSFKSTTDIETFLKMGFEEGFTAALENLDKLLEKRHELIQEHYHKAS